MYPKLIEIGDFYLPTYGVLVALGFLAGLAVTVKLARRIGLNPELITNLTVYAALSGMLGAKLLMFAFDWPDYAANPSSIFSFATLQAAGVYQGGLILAILVSVLYMRHQKLPVLSTMDTFAPGIALGHAIGRLGCLAAGCCWGVECDLPWAVTYHDTFAWAQTGQNLPLETPLHPTQLYESITEGILFLYLFRRFSQPFAPGYLIGLFLVLSSAARFVIEFYRVHEQGLPFGLPFSLTQWIAAGLAIFGAILIYRARQQPALNKSRLSAVKP